MNLKDELRLKKTENGLILTDGQLCLMADFSVLKNRILPHKLVGEMLVKAAKPPKSVAESKDCPLAIDATAGLGEDSFLLAAAGFRVIMIEKNPIIAALLRDAIERAQEDKDLFPIVSRMELVEGDSVEIFKHMGPTGMEASQSTLSVFEKLGSKPVPLADLVYLDPMFPGRTKSGLIKKKFQLLQQLESPEENPEELFHAAKAANPGRIIVKRPAKEAPITNTIKPTYVIPGKVIRYDCYFFMVNS